MASEFEEKREETLYEVSNAVYATMEEYLDDVDTDNPPLDEDLIDLFDNDDEKVAKFSMTVHLIFGVPADYDDFDEFNQFDSIRDFIYQLNYAVLNDRDLLYDEELAN